MNSEPDHHNDLGPSIKAVEQIIVNLQEIKDILDSPACWAFGADKETRKQMGNLIRALAFFEKDLVYLKSD